MPPLRQRRDREQKGLLLREKRLPLRAVAGQQVPVSYTHLWLRPEMPFSKVISEYGYPVVSKDVARRIRYARRGLSLIHILFRELLRCGEALPTD